MEPHWNRLTWFWFDYQVDCSLWVILLHLCWQDLLESVFLHCNISHFALQVCFHIFAVSSLPACERLSLFLHCIVDSMICFSQRCMFQIARTVWRLVLYWAPPDLKLFAIISWIRRWIFPQRTGSYYLGLCYAPPSFFWRNIRDCIVRQFFLSKICSDSFKLCLFET